MRNSIFQRRVAIFVYYGWIQVSPSIVSAIKMLTEQDVIIDIVYLYDKRFGYYEPKLSNVNMIPVMPLKNRYLRFLRFMLACSKVAASFKHNFYFGIDPEGIVTAGILGIPRRVSYVYYSLEILAMEDIIEKEGFQKLLLKTIKHLEVYFSRRAIVTVVQDLYRANILVKDNNILREKIILVPNSYYFSDNNMQNCLTTGIPEQKKILIYTGSIIPEMGIEDIITSADSWPNDIILHLHSPFTTEYLEDIEYYVKLNNLTHKILISINQLSFEELASLISRAHIGVAFYKPVDKNYKLSPSGKVSLYLSQGIPIIVNDVVPYLSEIVSKYRCGIVIRAPHEMGEAMRTISRDYSEFVKNAKRCYEYEFEFSKCFSKVLVRLENFE